MAAVIVNIVNILLAVVVKMVTFNTDASLSEP